MFSFIISSAKRTTFISFLGGESFLMILCYDTREISMAISDSLPFLVYRTSDHMAGS
jgi:hypothetical protein